MSNSDLTNQEKLEEVYRLTIENNHLLHKMQSRDRIALAIRVIYWLAILGALGGAFYYIRPIFESLVGANSQAQGMFHQFEMFRSQFPESKVLQNFFNDNNQNTDEAAADQG